MIARAEVHGAVSIVNAIAAGRGATVGIGLEVRADAERAGPAGRIDIRADSRSISSRLVESTVGRVAPPGALGGPGGGLRITLRSRIPTGYGLKSSSAISSAVALACSRLLGAEMGDEEVVLAGVEASLDAGVSATGAYDDACGCYYGGFAVTDNAARRIARAEPAPPGLAAVVFVPRSRRRGKPAALAASRAEFERAWEMARAGDYWGAMTLNGRAAAPALGSDPRLVDRLLEAGALGASVSGNGPAVAAIARSGDAPAVAEAFGGLEGRTFASPVSNKKAEVRLAPGGGGGGEAEEGAQS